MDRKTLLIILFALVCVAQLFVPAKMILDTEKIISEGRIHKFELIPIDPTDLFRGKYVTLAFAESRYELFDSTVANGDLIYVVLREGERGYAKIDYVETGIPQNLEKENNYLLAKVDYIYKSSDNLYTGSVKYPFDRYYMDETKAPEAEKLYRRYVRQNSDIEAYAIVRVKDGEAVLEEVMIDGKTLRDWTEEKMEEEAKNKMESTE